MNPELDAALVRDFPSLYRNRFEDMSCTAMCWGFQCGDGWEPIIRRLSEKLERVGAVASTVKEKYGTLRFYIEGVNQPTPLWLRLWRIFYHILHLRWHGRLWCWTWYKPWTLWRICDYPRAWDWIDAAEYESARVCEECGAPGSMRSHRGWLSTMCDDCHAIRV